VIGWRFAFTRRWIGYLSLTIVFAMVCVSLGFWQLARRAEARAEIDRVETNWTSDPQPIENVLPEIGGFDPDDKWMPVELTGTYRTDEQLLARNRPLGGMVGFEVLVPFELADGTVFLVDRGWVPVGDHQDEPDSVPPPPRGEVTVVARLKAGEPDVVGRSAPNGQVATINLPQIADLVDAPMYTGAYGLLDSERPAADRPIAAVKPEPDEGPHLSYAFQWFVFALLGFVGLGFAIRQEYRTVNADVPAERDRAAARAAKAARRQPSDAEIEDQLLER
jgi:cytochrome oxidase assembly protein ShyY1